MSTQPSSTVSITVLKCMYPDCGNEWFPRTDRKPKVCPKCKKYNWETGIKPKRKHGGGKDVKVRKNTHIAHIGPKTDQFLQEIRNKEN